MIPALFLDVDGVLNTTASLSKHKEIDETCLANLRYILASTKVELVLTSTWRKLPAYRKKLFKEIGFSFWSTPNVQGAKRGEEIATFLTMLPIPPRYVILDDNNDFLPEQQPYVVLTDPAFGLIRPKAEQVLILLNQPRNQL